MAAKCSIQGSLRLPRRVHAQCLKDFPGGVTLIALNIDNNSEHTLAVPLSGRLYTHSAHELLGKIGLLNGTPLELGWTITSPKNRFGRWINN
jgi:hypothetical protein